MAIIFINPGSGKVEAGSREQSRINIRAFIKDLGIKKVKFRFLRVDDDGRHIYILSKGKIQHDVEMPACKLENVRWLNSESGNIWQFPRLYVDGASWIWHHALNMCFRKD